MNKFDQTLYSIRKVILEGYAVGEETGYYIDFDMDKLNEKYVHTPISFDELVSRAKYYKVDIIKLDNSDREQPLDYPNCESFRIKSDDKQKILKFLASFIDVKKIDEVSAWVLRDNQISLDDDAMVLDKSTLP